MGGMPARGATIAQLRELVDRARPVALAHERTLPVLPSLEPLLPGGALRRGQVVAVAGGPGGTTLALALLAGPTRAGSWVACVGAPQLGWQAAAEVGVDLERTVVVRPPERSWVEVVAALVDAFDVVLCGPQHRPGAPEVRRLAHRARERGSVLVALGDPRVTTAAGLARQAERSWASSDVRLSVVAGEWEGPGRGWGHLRARRVTVSAVGRGELARPRRVDLWLPGPDGAVAAVATGETRQELAPVVPLRFRDAATSQNLERRGRGRL